jgi:hypothetical protein
MSKRMKATTVHGMYGEGATVAEAKKQAEANLAALVHRMSVGPRRYAIHGVDVMILPTESGWHWFIPANQTPSHSGYILGGCCMSGSLEDVVYDAIRGTAQWAWSFDVQDDAAYAEGAAERARSLLSSDRIRNMRSDLMRHFSWQRDYARLRLLGATDTEAHEHAGRDEALVSL